MTYVFRSLIDNLDVVLTQQQQQHQQQSTLAQLKCWKFNYDIRPSNEKLRESAWLTLLTLLAWMHIPCAVNTWFGRVQMALSVHTICGYTNCPSVNLWLFTIRCIVDFIAWATKWKISSLFYVRTQCWVRFDSTLHQINFN